VLPCNLPTGIYKQQSQLLYTYVSV